MFCPECGEQVGPGPIDVRRGKRAECWFREIDLSMGRQTIPLNRAASSVTQNLDILALGGAMGEYRKLWWVLIGVLTITFAILGLAGVEVYRKVPPIPDQVVSSSGDVLMTRTDILTGQAAWQSTGGMQLGSVWGTRRVPGAGLVSRLAAS